MAVPQSARAHRLVARASFPLLLSSHSLVTSLTHSPPFMTTNKPYEGPEKLVLCFDIGTTSCEYAAKASPSGSRG